jgi:hypothetical protein
MTFARDAARAPGEAPPPNLALVSIRPGPIEIVESLSSSSGEERDLGAATGSPPGWRVALAGVPDEPAKLALRSGSAVLGWMTPRGPLAVPALWDPEHAVCRVAGSVLARAEAPSEGPACLCLDSTHGKGPAAKHGLLLRGSGRFSAEGDVGSVAIDPDRITYWTGFETGTVAATPS